VVADSGPPTARRRPAPGRARVTTACRTCAPWRPSPSTSSGRWRPSSSARPPVLGRQGLHRHAASGQEGLLAGAHALPGPPRRHRAQLRPRCSSSGTATWPSSGCAWWWPGCRTTSTPAGRSRTRPGATRNRLQTPTLLRAIAEGRHDAVFGGARRDEEKARAKERIFSFRDEFGQWDPKNQRPELWNLYNGRHNKGEHIRVFPLSNWTELDVWQYIGDEGIDVPPIYFAHRRQVFQRDGMLMAVTEHLAPEAGEEVFETMVRFRTVGDADCTGCVESMAETSTSSSPRWRDPADRARRHPGRRPDFRGRHGGPQAGGVLLVAELLRLATAGSVDDGKSTLIGRLLYDAKGIFEDQLESIRHTSEQRGGPRRTWRC
jgi:3'-phosphoadenosine 5'-phosphosulfate sulfotransferase (PAPS reductase)/FAD synthetase